MACEWKLVNTTVNDLFIWQPDPGADLDRHFATTTRGTQQLQSVGISTQQNRLTFTYHGGDVVMRWWRCGLLFSLFFLSVSLSMKRFLITFSHRDDTIRLSLSIPSLISSSDLISMLTENIQKKDPNLRILVHHFEFYHPATNIFQEITDSDLETLLSLKNIHVLIIEDLLLRSSSTRAASDTLSPPSSSPFPILQIEGRAFNLNPEGIEINHLYLPIHESVEGREQGTGLNTWDGAVVLAKYLETSQGRSRIQKKHILEVGAGTGTAGLASFYLGGSLVVLTDLEYTLDNLRYNAQRAIETLHSSLPLSCSSPEEISSTSARALVLPLDWSDPATYLLPSSIDPSLPSHWDVILGRPLPVSHPSLLAVTIDRRRYRLVGSSCETAGPGIGLLGLALHAPPPLPPGHPPSLSPSTQLDPQPAD
jgi:hypothetical protein